MPFNIYFYVHIYEEATALNYFKLGFGKINKLASDCQKQSEP